MRAQILGTFFRLLLLSAVMVSTFAAEDGDTYNAQVGEIRAAFDKEVQEETAEHRDDLNGLVAKAIRDLERLAKRHDAIVEQVQIQKAILSLDRDNEQAQAFFTAIGNLDQTLFQLGEGDGPSMPVVPDQGPTKRVLSSLQRSWSKLDEDLQAKVQRIEEKRAKALGELRDDHLRDLERQIGRSDEFVEQAQLYRQILQVDLQHADARAFFSAIGTLDQVVAEVSAGASDQQPIDAAGDEGQKSSAAPAPAKSSGPQQITVKATDGRGSAGSSLGGPFPKGTIISFRYVSGAWTAYGRNAINPDPPGANSSGNIPTPSICSREGGKNTQLAVIANGTAEKPWSFTLPRAVEELILNMESDPRARNNVGSVVYEVEIRAAGAAAAPKAQATNAKQSQTPTPAIDPLGALVQDQQNTEPAIALDFKVPKFSSKDGIPSALNPQTRAPQAGDPMGVAYVFPRSTGKLVSEAEIHPPQIADWYLHHPKDDIGNGGLANNYTDILVLQTGVILVSTKGGWGGGGNRGGGWYPNLTNKKRYLEDGWTDLTMPLKHERRSTVHAIYAEAGYYIRLRNAKYHNPVLISPFNPEQLDQLLEVSAKGWHFVPVSTRKNGVQLGRMMKGLSLEIRYLGGQWTKDTGRAWTNPDQSGRSPAEALVLRENAEVIGEIPTGTGVSPFSYEFEQSYKGLWLSIAPEEGEPAPQHAGFVVYLMRLKSRSGKPMTWAPAGL